jgi:hypothetical protein
VSPVRYELDFNFPEDGILHSRRRGNLKSYIVLISWALRWRRNVSPVRYELGFYFPEDGILHSHRRENLRSYIGIFMFSLWLLWFLYCGFVKYYAPLNEQLNVVLDGCHIVVTHYAVCDRSCKIFRKFDDGK